MIDVTLLLRKNGYKVTPQRMAIYEALASTKVHPSAEILFQRLLPQYPALSLATVYKTMEILKTVGIVTVINVGEESFRYELTADQHPHLICIRCRGVEDAVWAGDADYKQWLLHQFDFTLHTQQLFFYGICKMCKDTE
jgi:Fur family transcriptional regulator, peroxide stress response regulator